MSTSRLLAPVFVLATCAVELRADDTTAATHRPESAPASAAAATAPARSPEAAPVRAPERRGSPGLRGIARSLPSIPAGWAAEEANQVEAPVWNVGTIEEASRSYFRRFVAGGDSVQVVLLADRGTGYAGGRFEEVARLDGAVEADQLQSRTGATDAVEVDSPASEASDIALLFENGTLVHLRGSSLTLAELRPWLDRFDFRTLASRR